MVAGLAGLLASLQAGIVLFPWDAGILTAFFRPDPVRAPLPTVMPYLALAVGAVLPRRRPWRGEPAAGGRGWR